MIALKEKNYDAALTHLAQANQQDPYNLYRQGLAYEGEGRRRQGEGDVPRAVEFNQLPTLNSAFVRAKAGKPKRSACTLSAVKGTVLAWPPLRSPLRRRNLSERLVGLHAPGEPRPTAVIG